jgi:hypothetical protein
MRQRRRECHHDVGMHGPGRDDSRPPPLRYARCRHAVSADRHDAGPAEYPAGRGQEGDRDRSRTAATGAKEGRQAEVSAGWQPRSRGRTQRDDMPQPGRAASAASEQLAAPNGWLAAGRGRETRRAVAHHGGQAAAHVPAGDRDGVPAAGRESAGLRAGVEQQVAAGRGIRRSGLRGRRARLRGSARLRHGPRLRGGARLRRRGRPRRRYRQAARQRGEQAAGSSQASRSIMSGHPLALPAQAGECPAPVIALPSDRSG